MIQITERKDFAEKIAYLIAANVTYLNAGVALKAPEAETLINQFIDQFEVPDKKPPFEPEGTIVGHIIRDKETKVVKYVNGQGLFLGEWAASAVLHAEINKINRYKYEIVPVRAHV